MVCPVLLVLNHTSQAMARKSASGIPSFKMPKKEKNKKITNKKQVHVLPPYPLPRKGKVADAMDLLPLMNPG